MERLLARRQKGQIVDGWVVLDKPLGLGSTQAVSAVRRLFDARKAGHGGTLDPLASGLLPIAFGEATKTVAFVMDGEKSYRFTVAWGERRDTDDGEGRVIASSEARPEPDAITALLPRFIGDIEQLPPAFSAIKLAGERAYDIARDEGYAAVEREMQPRTVTIHDLRLVERDRDSAVFEVDCGRGTYVRSIARDLGELLGCHGYVSTLRRTRVGGFDEAAAISMDALQDLAHKGALAEALLPIATALADIPALALTAQEATKLQSGQSVLLASRQDLERLESLRTRLETADEVFLTLVGDRPIALARLDRAEVRPVRVLNLGT